MSPAPSRLLFIRPDTYGDLVLFEPVLRLVRERWPKTSVAVVIREAYADLAPLLAPAGVRWLTTAINPYAEGLQEAGDAFGDLVEQVREFDPDCIVAACFEQTWVEPAIAARFPGTRQIRLGDCGFDVVIRASVDAETATDWNALYREKVEVETDLLEWEKNLRLAQALLGGALERRLPQLEVPELARRRATKVLAAANLEAGKYVLCATAGTANVQIKTWPVDGYATVVAWLEAEHGMRTLLVGHENEAKVLEAVREGARARGAAPALWLGRGGEMPVVAALAQSARIYFGNDTGTMHVAAAVGRPVAAIFGGGHWPRFKPAAHRSAVVVQPMACFGCGWNCIFGYAPCVREIPEEPVRRALTWLLSSDAAAEQEFVVEGVIASAGSRLVAGAAEKRRATQSFPDGASALAQEGSVASLLQKLAASENDRAARQRVIEQQGEEITRLKAEVARWIAEAGGLWPRVNAAENARNLLAAQLDEMRSHFAGSERDREARGQVLEEQGEEIARLQAEVERWLKEAGELWPRVNAAENARNLLAAQLEEMRGHFETSEADREARQRVIDEQAVKVSRLQQEVDRWLSEAGALWPRVNTAENACNLLSQQLEELRRHFDGSEADRAARLRVIEEQGAEITRLHAEATVRDAEAAALAAEVAARDTEAKQLRSELQTAIAELAALQRQFTDLEQHWTSKAAKALRLRRTDDNRH
ncbi:hypothetical protein BH20VER1_BH20VER1_18770 [soil metagenome]